MRGVLIFLTLILILPIAYGQCIEPTPGMELSKDARLCKGEYSLSQGIKITENFVNLDCNGAIIKCSDALAIGISLDKIRGTKIINCNIEECQNGISLTESSNNEITKNILINNKQIGIALENSPSNRIEGNIFRDNPRSIVALNSEVSETDLSNNVFDVDPRVIENIKEENIPSPILIDEPDMSIILPEEANDEAVSNNGAIEPFIQDEPVEEDEEVIKSYFEKVVKKRNPAASNKELEDKIDHLLSIFRDESKGSIQIERTFYFDENKTTVILGIIPKREMTSMELFEEIPKCVGLVIDNIVFENNDFEVIEEDPLIMWSFGANEITEQIDIKYTLEKKIGKDCADKFKSMGITDIDFEIKKEDYKSDPRNLIITLLIIPIVVGIIIYFSKFGKTE